MGKEKNIRFLLKEYVSNTNHLSFENLIKETLKYYNAKCFLAYKLINSTTAELWYECSNDTIFLHQEHNQLMDINNHQLFIDQLQEEGEFYSSIASQNQFGFSSPILAGSIIGNNQLIGFIIINEPHENTHDLSLLSSISAICYNELIINQSQNDIINSLKNIYSSLYEINLSTGRFIELSSIDSIHRQIGSTGDAQERLNYLCLHLMTKEFTNEMLEFVNLRTIRERLRNKKVISKQYLSTISSQNDQSGNVSWTECFFIEGQKDQKGELTHIVFAAKSVNESKIKELEIKKDLEEKNSELVELVDEKNKNLSILGALSNIFKALYYLNINENTVQEVFSIDNLHHKLGKESNLKEFFKKFIAREVSPSNQKIIEKFLDLRSIDKRCVNKKIIIHEYQDVINRWMRCSLIPIVDVDEKINRLLFTIREITIEKEQMASQDNLIKALIAPYESIYVVNIDTNNAICYQMGEAITNRYGTKFVMGNYEQNCITYIENDVYKEDRHLFDQIKKVKLVESMLKERNDFSFNYRVYRNDQIQYFQCQIVKPQTTRNEFVIAFKNIDEEKKQELKQQLKIEESLAEVEKINKLLQEEMAISGALSQEYHSLFKIDVKTAKISLYRSDGIGMDPEMVAKLMQKGNYETILLAYINTFVVPEDRERLKELSALDVLVKNVPDVGLYKLGYRRNMDGVVAYFEMNVVKVFDKNGEYNFILGIRDIDEEMRRQLKLTREMETQRDIIEGLSKDYYSVLLVDPKEDIVRTYRADNEDGESIADYFNHHHNCWSKGIKNYAKEMVSTNSQAEFIEKLSLDYIMKRKSDYSVTYEKISNGKILYLQAKVAMVTESDGRDMVIVGTRNVDDLIKKERQQEIAMKAAYDAAEAASKAKTDFLSNMSHDIRTPMNAIIGMTSIAAVHINDQERVLDSLQKITLASKHLLSLINEVLDMSKIESGEVNLVEEEFNLSDLIDNLLTIMNPQIEEHHHNFTVNITGVVNESLIGDVLRIQKVFTNIMSNAVKYTPDGGKISISITEKPTNQSKIGCFEFIFEDNGIGMSEDFVEKIFEPFTRAVDRRVDKIQGTGLGMSISRNIIRMMGGDIKVESKLGEGSRFIVTIYLKIQDDKKIDYQKFDNLNVLVVDDDELSLESCCSILNDIGMKAEGVLSGFSAIDKVVARHNANNDYFACIIDWKMADMSGIEITRKIRKIIGNEVPIIIISAYDWSDIEQEARSAGANAFINKPLFRSRLVRTFNNIIGEEMPNANKLPLLTLEKIDLKGRRALLVEDNELNAEIAKEILKITGIEVDHVSDGTFAVERMKETEDDYYDIIFMDIQMPKMNGYEATRVIRGINREYCQTVPIVAMTANAYVEDILNAKSAGMNEHIAKPIDFNVLAKTLNKWIK